MATQEPFFSIIIPTLNEEKLLPKLLDDITHQTFQSFEVIVVDGTSEDATREISQSYAKKYNVKVIEVSKRNVSYQRNEGSRHSRGRYLVFFDADVRIDPSFLAKLSDELKLSPFLVCLPWYESSDSFFQDKTVFSLFNFSLALSQKTPKPFSVGACLVFERNYFHFIGEFDDTLVLAEDHEIIQRAKKNGVTAKALTSAKVKVSLRRFHQEGLRKVLKKYIVATFHVIRNNKITTPLFEYKMGGDAYKNEEVKKSK